MFEVLYNAIKRNIENYKCAGCNGNKENNNRTCVDLPLMFKKRHNGTYIEKYDCDRKVIAYVIRFGAAYISEIYRYLESSKILEQYNNKILNVIALGCGFDPWYYAINKYITDKKLKIDFLYSGYDKNMSWNVVRPYHRNVRHGCWDLTEPRTINFNYYDFIIIDKVFSTIEKMSPKEDKINFLRNITNNFKNINGNRKHHLIFREQGRNTDIYTFDSFINNDISWKDISYYYFKGRSSQHLDKIIKHYELEGKPVKEIDNKEIIYDKKYNNNFYKLSLNTFFIQYSI